MSSGWQWFDAPQEAGKGDPQGEGSITTAFAKCFSSPDSGFSNICES